MISLGTLTGIFWLGMNIYHEARGEPLAGKILVAHVVCNRVITRHKPMEDIIFEPEQFSWTIPINGDDPRKRIIKEPGALLECLKAIQICSDQRRAGNFAKGVDHYHEENIHPYWADDPDFVFIMKVGKHLFYRDNSRNKLK